ncbi:MAG: hydroxyacid dehydrogenase [Proteobacteria bacterium]|nr:hydroxyacid dehydrogenase [Pseudomonadota bacterium]
MSKFKVYVLDVFHPAGVEFISRHADVVPYGDPRMANWREDADGIMVRMRPITADDFNRAKKLKVLAKQGVGVNTIDLKSAKAHGVTVCNNPGVNSEAVAELALTMGLVLGRRVAEMDRAIRSGAKVERNDYLGLETCEKTIGVVGMGNIGTLIARKYYGAFNAKILAYDPYVPASRWSDLPHERVSSLEAMLPRADILTLHVPFTDETNHMISTAQLALMKPTAIVVNPSRGGIVDEAALYKALKAGKLFGAGLDVWEEVEPPPANHPLMTLPNVIGTPHAAGGTRETQEKSSLLVGQQMWHVLNGGEPDNRVV